MKYYDSVEVSTNFEDSVARTRELLGREGFGVVSELNVRDTMRQKLGVDFRNYLILGACNPALALKALELEDKIGVMLPCSVVVQETASGVEVAAMDPVGAMGAIGNGALEGVAAEVKEKLARVIAGLS